MVMKLEHWRVVSRFDLTLPSPDKKPIHLQGIVAGHGIIPDGRQVTTSRVLSRRGDKVVTRSGSEYELGRPDRQYERLYPNALERLLGALDSSLTRVEETVCFEI
jgi:hypothetical protein